MSLLTHGSSRTALSLIARSQFRLRRRYASRIAVPLPPPPFPVIESCPSPTCQCREMPQGLDIDREQPLNGSMAAYAEQVLISTGRSDWKSRIEDEDAGMLVKQMKSLLSRGGKLSDPFHNVLITNSSFPPSPAYSNSPMQSLSVPNSVRVSKPGTDPVVPQEPPDAPPASAFLLPSFQYVPSIPTDLRSVETFLKAFVLPSRLHQSHDVLNQEQKNPLLRQPQMQRKFVGARKVNDILILICGHGGRDVRCGTLGPILKAEFEDKLKQQDIAMVTDLPVLEAIGVDSDMKGYVPTARVGLISHIGGHKFAGNVIIYIPPSFSSNALAGKGIWYGRVGPEHVEGIIAKTVLDGKVIKDMFRGGIDQSGSMLRM